MNFLPLLMWEKLLPTPACLIILLTSIWQKVAKKPANKNWMKMKKWKLKKFLWLNLKRLFLENKIMQATHNNCIFYALKELGEL